MAVPMHLSEGIMQALVIFMVNMKPIPFLMNLHQMNWALIYVCSMKFSIARAVIIRHQIKRARTMSGTGLIFPEQVSGNCCAMALCHQRKLFDRNLPGLPCKAFSQKVLMKITRPSNQSERPLKAFSHII